MANRPAAMRWTSIAGILKNGNASERMEDWLEVSHSVGLPPNDAC